MTTILLMIILLNLVGNSYAQLHPVKLVVFDSSNREIRQFQVRANDYITKAVLYYRYINGSNTAAFALDTFKVKSIELIISAEGFADWRKVISFSDST